MKTLCIVILCLCSMFGFGQNDMEKEVPLPLPKWTPPVGYSEKDRYLLGFTPATQQEFIADSSQYSGSDSAECTKYYIPDCIREDTEIIGQKNFGSMTPVASTTSFPYSASVKVIVKFPYTPQNMVYTGSGVLVNKNLVLTSGHMVYQNSQGGWAKSITVVPAYNNGNEPFGNSHEKSGHVYSFSGWIQNANYDWDIGIIVLDKPLGNYAGWFGYAYNSDNPWYSGKTFNNSSYPSENPFNGQTMYYRYGTFDYINQHNLTFFSQSYGGQSGSGLYYKNANNERHVHALLSNGYSNVTNCTRITKEKFDAIRSIMLDPTGIADNNHPDCRLTVYPNPATDHINLDLTDNMQCTALFITDVAGHAVYRQDITAGSDHIVVPVSALNTGFYCLTLVTAGNLQRVSFMKTSF